MAKMDWLVNIIKNNKDTRCDLMQEINKFMLKENFGNISCPTGAGKSAVVYFDIAKQIIKAKKEKIKKQIFVVSTPILRLNEQFTNDMFETLYNAGLINPENSICGQLSSDFKAKIGNIEIGCIDTEIRKCDAEEALKENCQNIFIIACHQSVEKLFTIYSKLIKKDTPIHFYFDESHTLAIKEN